MEKLYEPASNQTLLARRRGDLPRWLPSRCRHRQSEEAMSKELIERLRADAESTDDIGLCADAAERIEELERERDAFYMDYRMKCDEQTKSLCVERDALQADNAELVAALEPFGAIDLVESRLERRKAGPEKSWARSVGYEWRWKK